MKTSTPITPPLNGVIDKPTPKHQKPELLGLKAQVYSPLLPKV